MKGWLKNTVEYCCLTVKVSVKLRMEWRLVKQSPWEHWAPKPAGLDVNLITTINKSKKNNVLLIRRLSKYSSVQFTHSGVWLCDPMDCSTWGFPITNSWSLVKLMTIAWMMTSNNLILCIPFSSCLQSFPVSGSFQMNQFLASGSQSIGVSASTSVLPMNIQDWFL